MKKFFILFLAVSCLTTSSLAQGFKSPYEYMQFLGKQSDAVTKDMWAYTSSVARSRGARSVEFRRKELVKQIGTALSEIKSRPAYKNADTLKANYVKYMNINKIILNDDYGKLVDLEAVAEESYDQMEAYMKIQKEVNAKREAAGNALDAAIAEYAGANNITLVEDDSKIGKKLQRANKAFDYYEPIYLIFFKSYLQEQQFLEAFNANDVAGAEQAKNALKTTAEEGLVKLEAINSFSGDGSLILACRNILTFYKKEAETEFDKMLEFLVKKDTFDKVKKAFEGKKKNEITKTQADEFNNAANEYNAAITKYNTLNEKLNKDRSDKLNGWNEGVKGFLEKHAA